MTLFARELKVAPEAFRIARRLAAEPGFAFLWSAAGSGTSYLAVRPRHVAEALDPEPALAPTGDDDPRAAAPRWIGLLPYEAFRHLERAKHVRRPDSRGAPHLARPCWWRFGAVLCLGERATVVGDDAGAVAELAALASLERDTGPLPTTLDVVPGEPPERHAERVEAALELIRAGEIYQVNLARRIELCASGRAVDLLARMCASGVRPPFGAALELGGLGVVGTSPELLLAQEREVVWTRPIKGTRPRGRDSESDRRLAAELDADPKERAELSMVVDIERNDLGRVSQFGSVRLRGEPSVAAQGLVWHRHADVVGHLRAGVTRAELLTAFMPSGSVTGAPKVRAMEVISELEAERRGLYTGGIGYINHRGELRLAMAIRTLTLRDGVGHYFTGGGIVADSDPRRELEETRWKALQLFGRAGPSAIAP